jgi:hypothetical protein
MLIVGLGVAGGLASIVAGGSMGDHASPLVQTAVDITLGTCLLVEYAAVVALFIIEAKKRRKN